METYMFIYKNEVLYSIQLSYGHIKIGAEYENRTRLTSLEGWDTTNMPTLQYNLL